MFEIEELPFKERTDAGERRLRYTEIKRTPNLLQYTEGSLVCILRRYYAIAGVTKELGVIFLNVFRYLKMYKVT